MALVCLFAGQLAPVLELDTLAGTAVRVPENASMYGATAEAFATVAIVLRIERQTVFARDSVEECGGCR